MRRVRLLVAMIGSVLLLFGAWAPPALAVPNADTHSRGAKALANLPRSSDYRWNDPQLGRSFQSDLAFQANLAIAGNYNGFRVIDISHPAHPRVVRDVWCPGPQNDVSIWDDLIVTSVDDVLTGSACGSIRAVPQTLETGWEGLRIFSLRQVLGATPGPDGFVHVQPVGAVYTACGSHTHTGIPQANRVIVYVSSYSLRSGPDCGPRDDPSDTHDPLHNKISVVEIPRANPAAAHVLRTTPVVMPPWTTLVGVPGFNALGGCHDIQVFPSRGLAAAACASVGQLWDISDPTNPKTATPLWTVDEPDVDFYHSAAFTWDGKVVVFGDESNDGLCSTNHGAIWFHDARTGKRLGSFQIPRPQRETGDQPDYCSAHLFTVLQEPGAYRLVASWYSGGVSVVDFTHPDRAREVAFYDFTATEPADTEGLWAAYPYRGFVYTNGLYRGFDSLFIPQARSRQPGPLALNPQTQS